MDPQEYVVKISSLTLAKGSDAHRKGSILTLTPEQAEPLVRAGYVTPKPPEPPPAPAPVEEPAADDDAPASDLDAWGDEEE